MKQDELLESLYQNICDQTTFIKEITVILENFLSEQPQDWEGKLWELELKMNQIRNLFVLCQGILEIMSNILKIPAISLEDAIPLYPHKDFRDKKKEWQESILICQKLLEKASQTIELKNNVVKKLIEIYANTATTTYNSRGISTLENRHAAL